MTKADHTAKKHRVRSLIWRIILIAVAGITVGLSVYSWNAKKVMNNQVPMPFGFGTSVILSGSMEPTLSVNDLVFIVVQDEYHEDDIVVFQNGSELIIHRIIRIDGDLVITKGDANNVSDDPISIDQIKGKFAFRIPFIGLVIKFIKTLPGTLLILALAVFLMYRSRKKERKGEVEDLERIVAEINALKAKQDTASLRSQTGDSPETSDSVSIDTSFASSEISDSALSEDSDITNNGETTVQSVDCSPAEAVVSDTVSDDKQADQSPVQHNDSQDLSEIIDLVDSIDC